MDEVDFVFDDRIDIVFYIFRIRWGLYAIGNTAGGFYGGIDYDLEVDAFSLGRAVTTGRLAAQYAVE